MALLQNMHYSQGFGLELIVEKFNMTFASFSGLSLVLFHLLRDPVEHEFLANEYLLSLFPSRLMMDCNSFLFLGNSRIDHHPYLLLRLLRLGYDHFPESHYLFADKSVFACNNCYYFIMVIV